MAWPCATAGACIVSRVHTGWFPAAALVALVSCIALPPVARAEFSAFPSTADIDSRPGQAVVGTFNLRLEDEAGERFAIDVEDLTQTSDGSFEYHAAGTASPYSAASWVTILPRSFSGGPDRVQPIEYRVRIPENAEPGDYSASLTVRRLPLEGGSAAIVQAIGVRLNVTVAGETRELAEIENFDVPSIAGKGPITVSATIANVGNTTLDFGGGHEGTLEIEGEEELGLRGILLPGERRRVELRWDDPPLASRPTARLELSGTGGPLASESQAFWVLPWRQAGAIVLIALALLVVMRGRRRAAPGNP